jgi:hypothetical protein
MSLTLYFHCNSDFHFFLRAGAIEVMVICIFASSTANITSPLTALIFFLEYFAQFEWDKWEITATGPVDRNTLIPVENNAPLTYDIQKVVEKYQKLWLSSKEATTSGTSNALNDGENDPDCSRIDNSGNARVAVMDLLQPGTCIPLSSFLGLRSDQQHLVTTALSNAFQFAVEDIKQHSTDSAATPDMLFKNINTVTKYWHVRACQSTSWAVSSTKMLETPETYILDILSISEFMSIGKITGEDIVRASAYILTFEGKPMRAMELIALLQTETGNNRKFLSSGCVMRNNATSCRNIQWDQVSWRV